GIRQNLAGSYQDSTGCGDQNSLATILGTISRELIEIIPVYSNPME
ncbi:unnamed protein product, partial [Rotaria socialis]